MSPDNDLRDLAAAAAEAWYDVVFGESGLADAMNDVRLDAEEIADREDDDDEDD